jgi:hypothetical protein
MPISSSLACPTCGTDSLRLVLKTSWGEYYACAPCHWSIFCAEPSGGSLLAGALRPVLAAPALPNATPASEANTAA